MPKDTLKDFVAMRQSLINEKQAIEIRLSAINAAFGSEAATPAVPAKAAVAKPTTSPKARKGAARAKNDLSLREAVLKVVSAGPKTKQEILDGVKKLGYRFGGKDPMNSLGVILYGKPKFKNDNGKFSSPK